jgi:hypothetical protein
MLAGSGGSGFVVEVDDVVDVSVVVVAADETDVVVAA